MEKRVVCGGVGRAIYGPVIEARQEALGAANLSDISGASFSTDR